MSLPPTICCAARAGNFAEGVLTQISALIGLPPEGLIAAKAEMRQDGTHTIDEPIIVSAAGRFRSWMNHPLREISDHRIADALRQSLENRTNVVDSGSTRCSSKPARNAKSPST